MKESLAERIIDHLTPLPAKYKCGVCGKPRLKDALTCAECDQELFEMYVKEREEDLKDTRQCNGCGKWIDIDKPFCDDMCLNDYMNGQKEIRKQQELKKIGDKRCKTLNMIK